jgi:hypothetical protein
MSKKTVQKTKLITPTGLYEEKIIMPTHIEFDYDEETKSEFANVKTANEEFIISDPAAYKMFFYYYDKKHLHQLLQLSSEEKTKTINDFLKQKPKKFKLQFDSNGEVAFVVSGRFQQIAWNKVKTAVNTAIIKTYKVMPETFDRLPNAWNYKMPLKHQNLDFWYEVYAGRNLGSQSKRTLTITVRTRTIAPLKGMEAPCLNWSVWKPISNWFNISTRHILNVVPSIKGLITKSIHVKRGEDKIDVKELTTAFKQQAKALEESTKVIDDYVHTELDKDEIQAIIEMYALTKHLPKYVIKDLPDLIKEPTIWGLSNAFSFFRTHCEYKKTKKPREEVALTTTLEFIAGELMIVSPLIAELKKQVGKITKDLLLNPPKDFKL